jgi:SAM-dependent methyltransferase
MRASDLARPLPSACDVRFREARVPLVTQVRDVVNAALRPLNVQVIRGRATEPGIVTFLPARKTIAAAQKAGLTVADYVDREHAEAGTSQRAVDFIVRTGALASPLERVCEIGPGTGRYAAKLIEVLKPETYEMYEPARDWQPTLRELPGALLQPTDGRTLASTPDASVDLVHTHKLFVYCPFVTTVRYAIEMARVARPGGIVAFDAVTEPCFDDAMLEDWLSRPPFYVLTPRDWLLELLDRHGLSLLDSDFYPLSGGRTELLVFRKR